MGLSADDKFEICELLSLISHYSDRGNFDKWCELFEPDGQWLAQTAKLRTREDFDKRRKMPATAAQLRSRHWTGNVIITEIDGASDRAKVCSDVVVFRAESPAGPAKITYLGTYDDIVRKVNGQWRFEVRTMTESNVLMSDS